MLAQSSWLSFVKKHFNDIEDICNGIFVLGELTDKIKDRITSYGEFLSSSIIAARLQHEELDCLWMNSAELIKTDSNFTNAKVDFAITENNLKTMSMSIRTLSLSGRDLLPVIRKTARQHWEEAGLITQLLSLRQLLMQKNYRSGQM